MFSHHFDPTNVHITSCVRSVLAIALTAQEPMPPHVLIPFASSAHDLTDETQPSFQRTSHRLVQLLADGQGAGVRAASFGAAFRAFLAGPSKGNPFIPEVYPDEEVAIACFRVMSNELHFNICEHPSSFLRNSDVENLASLVTPHLHHACKFWTYYLSRLDVYSLEIIQRISDFFHFHFLSWLEVMSAIRASPRRASSIPILKGKHDTIT